MTRNYSQARLESYRASEAKRRELCERRKQGRARKQALQATA